MTEVLLVAGDPSGDRYAADVVEALKGKLPSARFVGLGGPHMEAAGVHTLAGLEELAVMGFGEVVMRLEFFRDLERKIHELLLDADLVVLVDFPGFNMRIARTASVFGRPVLYYIPPKVWASRPGRAEELAKIADHIAVIFPFEVNVLGDAGADVTFVGNPLLDRPDNVLGKGDFHKRFGLDPDRPILAMLPGSREQEIKQHLQLFLDTAEMVTARCPHVQPVVSKAEWLNGTLFEGLCVPVIEDTRGLLRHARAGLVKSGTATLEAAIEGMPFVVAYRTSSFSWAIVKRMLRVKYISLVNLMARDSIVPELIQGDARPKKIARHLIPLFDDKSPEYRRQVSELPGVTSLLGSSGSAERVANLAVSLLGLKQ